MWHSSVLCVNKLVTLYISLMSCLSWNDNRIAYFWAICPLNCVLLILHGVFYCAWATRLTTTRVEMCILCILTHYIFLHGDIVIWAAKDVQKLRPLAYIVLQSQVTSLAVILICTQFYQLSFSTTVSCMPKGSHTIGCTGICGQFFWYRSDSGLMVIWHPHRQLYMRPFSSF